MSRQFHEELLTLDEVAHRCGVEQTFVLVLIEHGVIEPQQETPLLLAQEVTFRINKAARLNRDLGVNVPGASVIIELLERIDELEERLALRRRG